MNDFINDLTQDICQRDPEVASSRRARWLTGRLRHYAVGSWIWGYFGLLLRNFFAPTLFVAGILALGAGVAGWSTIPGELWLIAPALGVLSAGAYAYRDKPPRTITAGEIIIARRNIKHHIHELEREQRIVLQHAEQRPELLLRQEDLRHLLGHCEFVCRDIGAIDPRSADALRDAAARIAKDVTGDLRYGAVVFPSGPNPPALLVARNLGGWIVAAHEIADVLAPAGQRSLYDG